MDDARSLMFNGDKPMANVAFAESRGICPLEPRYIVESFSTVTQGRTQEILIKETDISYMQILTIGSYGPENPE